MKSTKTAVIAALVCIAVLTAGCTKKEQSNGLTLKNGVLSIAMEIGYPPFEYYDKDGTTPIGFDVQLGKAIAEKLGIKAEFIDTAWDGIFAGLNTDKYDAVISAVTITEERLTNHNFSVPYIGNSQAIVLLKDSALAVKNTDDLTGLRVAYQAETTSDIFTTKLIANGLKVSTFEYDKVMNCFNDLKLKRCDAIICDSLVAVDYVNAENSPFVIVWKGTADEKFGVCMKKGNDALTDAVNKALADMWADGTIMKISENIFKMDMVSSVH